MPSFHHIATALDFSLLGKRIRAVEPDLVDRVLARRRPTAADAWVLASPAAAEQLERMARRAAQVTAQRFGKVVNLYAPLYLSNECTNRCRYCGFASDAAIDRQSLSLDEAVANAEALHAEGFRHLLLVTGEHERRYGVARIEEVVRAVGDLFHSIAIEVFPMSTDDYRRLEAAGVDGLTLYQETYDTATYDLVHPGGRKRDYRWRLEGPERGGAAGFRSLGIGALLGLADWRVEAVALALHAEYLTRRFWRSRIAISFPRLVAAEREFEGACAVSDAALIQMMVALRLILSDAEMVVSTREPPALRDRLPGLGVTRMSAGSKTSPGGYLAEGRDTQFEVRDDRSPAAISAMLVDRGFDPVWKDFDIGLRGGGAVD
jgi:2-iminoacetate synthase